MELLLWVLGTGVAAIAYLIKTLVADPWLAYRTVVGRIDADLIFYSNVIHGSPGPAEGQAKYDEASAALRRDASELLAAHNRRILITKDRRTQVQTACSALIGLSNITGHDKVKQSLVFMDQVVGGLGLWRSHGGPPAKGNRAFN